MKTMNVITEDSLADIELQLNWKSNEAEHSEVLFTKMNVWRDILPPGMTGELMGKGPGDRVGIRYAKDENLLPSGREDVYVLKRGQFDDSRATPRYGRFYPMSLLTGVPHVFPGNVRPFRLTDMNDDTIQADAGHPLAGYDLALTAKVHDAMVKPYDRGGECSMLIECVADGPGMQVPKNGRPTDFFEPDAFAREDETDDSRFYENPRLVNHLDDRAIETISGFYGGLLQPGMDVLDLMSAWRSHVPEGAGLKSMIGLGMNAEEMAENPQLNGFRVHDLNIHPKLPFDDRSFDRVICTASVEYLIHPDAVFADVARVLRAGGIFALTFSNRWFPPKTIRLWPKLHEFERMGLVLAYFNRSGKFTDLHTLSSRGWPRPETDKYYGQQFKSDPVYAVWGKTIA
ncbi:MAG: SAM-dependent methyltransferase [Desulfobacteraceae bacterium]|nr:MAG: SAM-dependent methyltransferase [Desulfobacteraceae bacterium]